MKSINNKGELNMQVTNVKFNKYEQGKMAGFAEVTFDDELKVTGIIVFKTGDDVSCAMPSKENKKKEGWFDIVYCLDADLRAEILTGIKEKIGIINDGGEEGLPF